MRTIQSQYIPMGEAMYGGGTKVHKEVVFNGAAYALIESLEWRHKFNPAGYRKIRHYRVASFVLETTEDGKEFWSETSYADCKNKSEANATFRLWTRPLKGTEK